jgi:transposase-like protein
MSTGKKRFWSDDEKREICGQARVEGVSVAQVARRYAMNANLIQLCLHFCNQRLEVISPGTQELVECSGFVHSKNIPPEPITTPSPYAPA